MDSKTFILRLVIVGDHIRWDTPLAYKFLSAFSTTLDEEGLLDESYQLAFPTSPGITNNVLEKLSESLLKRFQVYFTTSEINEIFKIRIHSPYSWVLAARDFCCHQAEAYEWMADKGCIQSIDGPDSVSSFIESTMPGISKAFNDSWEALAKGPSPIPDRRKNDMRGILARY